MHLVEDVIKDCGYFELTEVIATVDEFNQHQTFYQCESVLRRNGASELVIDQLKDVFKILTITNHSKWPLFEEWLERWPSGNFFVQALATASFDKPPYQNLMETWLQHCPTQFMKTCVEEAFIEYMKWLEAVER